ncbi:SRPBCC family protein [Candidatus Neomarinimicrobiota bacterium]
MIILEDSIEVKASPEQVFDWLAQRMMDKESYRAWHPEHVDIRWIKGEPMNKGSVVEAEEYLHDILHKLVFRITKVDRPSLIEYRPLFPLSIISTGNRFMIESSGEGMCTFTAWGKIRFPLWLFNNMHKAHPAKLAASKRHMKEEGENLKQAVEQLHTHAISTQVPSGIQPTDPSVQR